MGSVLVDLVGVPYETMNCWDLARLFYKKTYGLELKHYYEDSTDRLTTQNLIYTNRSEFIKVDAPNYGDIILFKVRGIESHIGIFLGEGFFLHTTKATGSVIDRISRWDKVITGYYRPAKEGIVNHGN